MSVFPLNIPEKTNTPALLAFFQQFGLDKYLSAEEINKITEALTELKEASANVSIINTIFVNNNFDKTGQLFTGFANSQWNINGFNYTNPTDQEITIPLCSTGKERTDRIVLDTNNNFVRVPGVEVDENPVPPAKPANTLDYTLIPVNDTEVGAATPPILGSNFNKKIYDNFYTYTGTGTDVVIPLPHDGQSNIYLSGSMTSVAGFDFSEFLANPTNAEYPHTGKKFMLTNLSGHDITLLNGVGTLDVFFDLIGGTDLVIPDGKSVFFNGNTNVFIEIDRNWIDTSNKLDKVTTADVEKVYIKNADGTQGMKPVSEFGGSGESSLRSHFISFELYQNNSAQHFLNLTSFDRLGSAFTDFGRSYVGGMDEVNDLLYGYRPIRFVVPFKSKIKRVLCTHNNLGVELTMGIYAWEINHANPINQRTVAKFLINNGHPETRKNEFSNTTDIYPNQILEKGSFLTILLKTNTGYLYIQANNFLIELEEVL